jgi:anti-sigma factor RsiW
VTHDELRDLLPGHALHALGHEDERAVEAHLATCAECRRELAALR